jgi:hypothetical protein
MRPFTAKHRLNAVYQWLSLNATGECSILVDLPDLGTCQYIYTPWIKPLFQRLWGPVHVTRTKEGTNV